jgi:serine phosphatase RsbU (regulator of sigma subunit)
MTIFFILAMVFAGATSNFLIFRYALDSQFEQLRDKLIVVAQIAALRVDVAMLAAIPLNKEGSQTVEYKTIAEKLAQIKKAIPSFKYLYILTRTDKPGMLQFVVDADSGNAAEGVPSYPGDPYDASRFPEMMKGFDAPAADKELGADEWGVFLSGYAPIRDTAGRAVAIIGVDMKAEDVHAIQEEVRRRAVLVFLLGILLAVLLGFLISGSVARQVKELMKGAERVARGDLEWKVKVKGADEIAQLAHLFNKMSVDLKSHIDELKRTTAEKERLVREIEIAKGIQQSFLPESAPKIPGIDIAAMSLPARVVGGDFYDFIPIDKDRWGLVIADVSGKGVPAALFMALSRTLMRASVAGALSPAEVINHANYLIQQDTKSSMFVTLFYAVLDGRTMTLTFANAGHNPPMLIGGAGEGVVLLKAQGVPLGIASDIKSRDAVITLKKGDCLVLYTDGVTEARNAIGAEFDMDRLEKTVRANRSLDACPIMDAISEELTSFVGGLPQFDDITMMVIKAA